MPVPSRALLWLAALTVIPAATAITMSPALAPVGSLVIIVVVMVAVFDLTTAGGALRRVRISLPDVVRTTKGRAFDLDVTVDNPGGRCRRLRLGLMFPEEIHPSEPLLSLTLPPGTGASDWRWQMTALRRGCTAFDRIWFETRSLLGLWLGRRSQPVSCEVRIYPDLRRERRGLAAVFLNRGSHGQHARAQIGKGREFDHLREYVPGDDYGDIHWKSTARRGIPITRTFQIERTREVYVLIDHSRFSARESSLPVAAGDPEAEVARGGESEITTRLEQYLRSALVLGLAAEQQRDLFGIITFADQVTRFVRSGNGQHHYNICRDAIYALQPRLVSPDFEELFVFLRKSLTRRSLLIILTDLSDPLQAESFLDGCRLVARQHLVMVHQIRQEGVRPLFTTSAVETAADVCAELSGHFQWQDLQEVGKVLGRMNIHYSLPESAVLSADVVTQYMTIKQRQLL